MRLNYLHFAIFLLLLNTVSSSTLSYEGWVYNNKYLIFEQTSYKVLISEGGTSILMQSPSQSISLDLDECYDSLYREFCFNSSAFDSEQEDYKAYISIYYMQPEIEITRAVTDNILSLGDDAEFTVILENTGDADAERVYFSEDIPDSLKITDTSTAKINKSSVYWEGKIKKGESVTLEYNVESVGPGDKYLKAAVRYYEGVQEKVIYSEPIRMYSETVFDIELSTDKEEYELREEISFNITLENKGSKTLDVNSLNILLPEGLEVAGKKGSSRKSDYEYHFSEDIADNDTEILEFELVPKKSGVFFIVVNGDYDYNGEHYELSNLKLGFLVTNQGVEITTSLEPQEYAYSNEQKLIFAKIKNKNSFSDIKNIQLTTQTDLANIETTKFSRLRENETIILLNNEFTMPFSDSEKEFAILFNVTYETEDNEMHSESLERKIRVRPAALLKVVPTYSGSNVLEEEQVDISVVLSNPSDKSYNEVFVKSELPAGFIAKGATAAYSSAEANEDVTVLVFEIYPGIVSSETAYALNFSAAYIDDGKEFLVSSSQNIIVSPRIPKITLQKSLEESSVYRGGLVDVTYTITNEDSNPVYDLYLEPAGTPEFDNIGAINYIISKLNPGESETFRAEQIRPKKAGMLNAGHSIFFFTDKNSRRFNTSSGGISLEVNEADINGPAFYIEKYLTKNMAETGEEVTLKINITNIGLDRATGILDGDKKIDLPFYRDVIIESNVSYDLPGTYKINKSVLEYTYLGGRIYAYSNEPVITIVNKTVSQAKTPADEPDIEMVPEDNAELIQKKPGFLKWIWQWFVGLFNKI